MGWLHLYQSSMPLSAQTRYRPEKVSAGAIASISKLCDALDVTMGELNTALALPASERYKAPKEPQYKKDGTVRTIFNPCTLLRKIQRRMNRRIFSNENILAWPDHLYGSIPSTERHPSDYVACASRHCGAKSIAKLDIKNFFDNIGLERTRKVFREVLDMPSEVAIAAADLCCLDGRVPQGALTSSYIASLCLFDCEDRIVRRLEDKGLTYTRLVDDITISSKVANYDFSHAIRVVTAMLDDAGLPLNSDKENIQYASSNALTVHGLRVSFSTPRLPSDEVRRIRAAVQNLEKVAAEPGYRCARGYRADFNRCMGRVNKLSRVGHSKHKEFINRLRKVFPLPSKRDIDWCSRQVSRLERDFPVAKDTYGYHLRFWVLHDRLTILGRSFPVVTKELRAKWSNLKPTFD